MQTQTDIHFDFHVPMSADVAQAAISRVRDWWIRDTEGPSAALGDTFTVKFGQDGFVRFTITEAVPERRIVWHVADCFLPWFADKTEWTGTDVVFEIAPTAAGSAVALTHRGLTPAVACYDKCVAGWEKYFMSSLQQLITTGAGSPQ